MGSMRSRALLFALLGGLAAVGGAFVACSSGGTVTQGVDGGSDATTGQPEATVFDTGGSDGFIAIPDGGRRDVHRRDAGGPIDAGDAHAIDTGPLANCSLVTGACDIVAQNCSAGSECVVLQGSDGGFTTGCVPTQATEHLPKGQACCPSVNGTNPCDPGLECNGGNYCNDAGSPGAGLPPGWGGSRCTPRCCPSDGGANTSNCGTAGDGGAQGHCDLLISLTLNGPAEYAVCTYPQTCEPLGIRPCLPGFACEIQNAAGTSTCAVIYNPNGDAGATAGQACEYENQCADGLACIGTSASNSTCLWLCDITGQATPFDAGELKTTPGKGGCPAGDTCQGVNGFPAWLGVCGT